MRLSPKCHICHQVIYTSPEFSYVHMEHNPYTEPEWWICRGCWIDTATEFQLKLAGTPLPHVRKKGKDLFKGDSGEQFFVIHKNDKGV